AVRRTRRTAPRAQAGLTAGHLAARTQNRRVHRPRRRRSRLPRRPCGGDGTAARAHREGDRRGPAPSPRRTCAGLRTVPAGAVGGVERRVLPRRAEGEIMRAGIVKGAIAALASVSLLAACGGGDEDR